MISPDDKTAIAQTLPALRPAQGLDNSDNVLPVGTRLGEFELISLIGIGGFGIVYLAEDHSLGRRVAVKEYMPASLASRAGGKQVCVRSERHRETFEAGRRSFVNEAHFLAQFDHPALVKVYRFWEENGTAYMVMPYYRGMTLKRMLFERPEPPDEQALKRLLAPLLDALEVIHAAHVFHRDISPDNILLLEDERPLLLDFGAARHVISDMTQALTAILKPGYAPIEQYAEMTELKQGAWTDIYALSAVVYFAIIGKTPPPAVGRIVQDTIEHLARGTVGRYSDAFRRGIDRGLAVQPKDRPQSIAEFRNLLGIGQSPELSLAHRARLAVLVATGAAVAIAASVFPFIQRQLSDLNTGTALTEPKQSPSIADSEALKPAAKKTADQHSLHPLDEIDRIFRERNRDHAVTVAIDQARVRIGQDRLSFRVRSSRSGYLYILMVGTDNEHFYKLFPNAVDQQNRINAGEEISLPRAGWSMIAGGPPGANQFLAVVSENAREFADAALAQEGLFAEFAEGWGPDPAGAHSGEQSPFLGEPRCARLSEACSREYGAATFTIEEVDDLQMSAEPPG